MSASVGVRAACVRACVRLCSLTVRGQLPEQHLIQLYNVYGQLLKTRSYTGSQDRLSTQDLDPGMYFIVVTDQDKPEQRSTIRLVVR